MALLRILIDGYSLLHSCPEIAQGRPPHSAAARDLLMEYLGRYQDAIQVPITVVFDGLYAPPGLPAPPSAPELEVLFSKPGQTADQVIERVAQRLAAYGEFLVVTDDTAERETVAAFGGGASSCENFFRDAEYELGELSKTIERFNRRERGKFRGNSGLKR